MHPDEYKVDKSRIKNSIALLLNDVQDYAENFLKLK